MSNRTGLLPWLSGVLGIAAGAAAAVVIIHVLQRPADVVAVPAGSAVTAVPAPQPTAQAAPAAVVAAQPAADSAAAPEEQPPGAAPLAPNQVWQCVENGARTFSDYPCSDHPSVLDLGPVNAMQPPTPSEAAFPGPQPDEQDLAPDEEPVPQPSAAWATGPVVVIGARAPHERKHPPPPSSPPRPQPPRERPPQPIRTPHVHTQPGGLLLH